MLDQSRGEKEIKFLKERIEAKEEQLKQESLFVPEKKELLIEAIEEKIEDSFRNLPPVSVLNFEEGRNKLERQNQADDFSEDAKVKELTEMAFKEGIVKAVTVALKTSNAFLIDKLRDTLADKYYKALKERKLI